MNSNPRLKKPLLLKFIIDNDERLITHIEKQPFYRSTGINSNSAGTFFPFGGFKFSQREQDLWFIKPRPQAAENLGNFFPGTFISFIGEIAKEKKETEYKKFRSQIFTRMGNFRNLTLSMLLGGGFWDTPDGKTIAEFITDNYKDYLNNLKNQYADIIEVIKSAVSDRKKIKKIKRGVTQKKILASIDKVNELLSASSQLQLKTKKVNIYVNGVKKTLDVSDPNAIDYTFKMDTPIAIEGAREVITKATVPFAENSLKLFVSGKKFSEDKPDDKLAQKKIRPSS